MTKVISYVIKNYWHCLMLGIFLQPIRHKSFGQKSVYSNFIPPNQFFESKFLLTSY